MGFLRKLEKRVIRPVAKNILPLVGSVAGGMFGGPAGAIAGGAIGGAFSSKKHPLDHALGGAALGLGTAFLGPKLGSMFGVDAESTMGHVLGMQSPSITQQVSSLLGPAAYMGAPTNINRTASVTPPNPPENSGFLSSLGPKDLLDAALLGTSIVGTLGARTRYPKGESPAEIMAANRPRWGAGDMPKALPAYKRRYIQPQAGYEGGYHPEHQFLSPLEGQYAAGGYVSGGYIPGHSGGQADDVNKPLKEGSYVMDATTVSLLGDGNSLNGKRRLEKMQDHFVKSGITKGYVPPYRVVNFPNRAIDAKVSSGEFIFDPEAVTAAGKGSNSKGSKALDKFRNNLRKQKGVTKFLPPKSKDFKHYMR